MATLRATGSSMPPDFPAAVFDRVLERVAAGVPHTEYQWAHFGPAWNAIAYRFLGAAEADDSITASLVTHGTAPPPPERTRQELDMFSFVSCACSTMESAAYGLFGLGAMLSPSQFPMATAEDLHKVTIRSMQKALIVAFPADPMGALVETITRDSEFTELVAWRNVLIHRASAGRLIQLSAGSPATPPPPDVLKLSHHQVGAGSNLPLGPSLTRDTRSWLAQSLTSLLEETDRFLGRKAIP